MATRTVVACLVVFFVACSPYSTSQCVTDPDCGIELVCDRGLCIAQPEGTCRSDETRPCGPEAVGLCHPGTQRCSDRHFVEECVGAVTPVAELCNGLDDDCDGVVDDGVTTTYYPDLDGDGFGSAVSTGMTRVGCAPPAGYVASHTDCNDSSAGINPGAAEVCDPMNVDENCNGTANEGCGCSNVGMSQGCCADRGTQVCEAHPSGPTLSVCTVSPTPELCNGVDDDCDGQADEQYELGSADGGSVITDAGVFSLDGGCTVGVGACARTAATTCSGGGLACNVTPGSPSNEQCNGLDDDCDGQTDEAGPNLCPVSGQTCTTGSCACPSGQSVCGSSCAALGGSCSAGVGACARTGAIACISGGVACNAVPGTPATETCDGVDNDCDGSTDEGVTVNCVVDADNDTAQGGNTVTAMCPDNSRGTFGFCPAGFVAPAASTGIDCNDSNAAVYRFAATYADADNDTRCAGQESTLCIGASPPVGRRLTSSCTSTADCNDNDANAWILGSTRADSDNDGYCAGVAANTCNGTSAPAGRRFPANCNAIDDCDDTTATKAISRQVRTDSDGDLYCSGAVVTQCGAVAGPNAGTRLATSCMGDDCKDTNAYATSTCYLAGGYQTTSAIKQCGVGYAAQENKAVTGSVPACPVGFSRINAAYLGIYSGDSGGSCTPTSDVGISMSCGSLVFGSFSCSLKADCIAN